jgi:predicted Zn finger-like uncharacterized protein
VNVTCGECSAQFRLEDSRVGPRGLRVRCSHCQHVFTVSGPATQPPETLVPGDSAAGAASSFGAPPTGEESWSFEIPERPRTFERRTPVRLDDPEPVAQEPAAPAASELGAPESWDILAGIPNAAESEAAKAPSPEIREPAAPRFATATDFSPIFAARDRETLGAGGVVTAAMSRAHAGIAWAGTAALTLWGLAAVVWPNRIETTPPLAAPAVAGIELEVERWRYVENAGAGFLFVVEGELRGTPSSASSPSRLELVLLDADGRELPGSRVPLGAPVDETALRTDSLENLSARQLAAAQSLAQRPLRPAETARFAAIARVSPREARGWRIRAAAP